MDNKSTSALQQQSSCDNNNVCDDHNKMSNSQPSWLSSQLSSLSVLLPSNFLNLPPRWRDWFIRGQSGIFLISCFFILISLGPLGLFSLTLIVQFSSYYEVIQLGIKVTQITSLTTWCWLVFMIGNLYYIDPMVAGLLPMTDSQRQGLCFLVYLCLVSWFVVHMRNTSQCLPRYSLLAWSHLSTWYLVGAGYLMNLTLRHGMVWYIFSMSIITINDISAYMCGFFFGSTPLIVLSPKKTVEGFIGGGIITIISGPVFGAILQQYPHLTATYPDIQSFSPNFYSGNCSPFVWHCLVISIFASTFGPVAGFFCSGFKRAFDQKNFGCLIPGHGGVLDRCDCMFLMAVFTYVYLDVLVI